MRLALKDEVARALRGEIQEADEAMNVYVVQPWLVAQHAKASGRSIELVHNNIGDIRLLFVRTS